MKKINKKKKHESCRVSNTPYIKANRFPYLISIFAMHESSLRLNEILTTPSLSAQSLYFREDTDPCMPSFPLRKFIEHPICIPNFSVQTQYSVRITLHKFIPSDTFQQPRASLPFIQKSISTFDLSLRYFIKQRTRGIRTPKTEHIETYSLNFYHHIWKNPQRFHTSKPFPSFTVCRLGDGVSVFGMREREGKIGCLIWE